MNAGILYTGKYRPECRERKLPGEWSVGHSVSGADSVSRAGFPAIMAARSGSAWAWVAFSGRRRLPHASEGLRGVWRQGDDRP